VFRAVWVTACEQATGTAQTSLAHEQNALLAAQTSLAQERKIWEIAIAEAQGLAQNADQGRAVAEMRLADVQRLVEQQATKLFAAAGLRAGLYKIKGSNLAGSDHKCLKKKRCIVRTIFGIHMLSNVLC
jgi:hypothetical protein